MAATLQKKPPMPHVVISSQPKVLNAESVTAVATGFLKRIGHKGALKPKKVFLKEKVYTVEIDMKKFTAFVRVDSETHEIKEYELQPKAEEASSTPFAVKPLLITFGISTAVWFMFHFLFKMLGM
ncbi:MAG: hypothetical protein QXJ02_03535 [Candidatus Bathyarchaeia archaeon]